MRYLVIAVVALLVLSHPVRADEEKVPLDKVPKPVLESAKKRFPKAEVVGASIEKADGKTVYEIELKEGGKTIDVTLTPEGNITLIEKQVNAKELPKGVTETLDKKYPQATFKIVEEVSKVKDGKEAVDFYEILPVTADKKTIEVQVTTDGKVKSEEEKKPEKKDDKKADAKEGDEFPKSVAEAVKSKFPGGKVVEVEKENEDGKTVYEVTIRYKSGNLEATLTAGGDVVKVKLKAKDEDDQKGNKKGEADEKKGKGKSSGFQGEQKGQNEDKDDGNSKKSKKGDVDEKGDKNQKDCEHGQKNHKGDRN